MPPQRKNATLKRKCIAGTIKNKYLSANKSLQALLDEVPPESQNDSEEGILGMDLQGVGLGTKMGGALDMGTPPLDMSKIVDFGLDGGNNGKRSFDASAFKMPAPPRTNSAFKAPMPATANTIPTDSLQQLSNLSQPEISCLIEMVRLNSTLLSTKGGGGVPNTLLEQLLAGHAVPPQSNNNEALPSRSMQQLTQLHNQLTQLPGAPGPGLMPNMGVSPRPITPPAPATTAPVSRTHPGQQGLIPT
eukprot:gene2458-8775_t